MSRLVFFLALLVALDAVCVPNYDLVPSNPWLAYFGAVTPLVNQGYWDTVYLVREIAYVFGLGYSCYANYNEKMQSFYTLTQNKVPSDQWNDKNATLALLSGLRNGGLALHPDIFPQLDPFFASVGLNLACSSADLSNPMTDPQSNCQAETTKFSSFILLDGWNTDGSLNRQNKPQKYNRIVYTDYTNRIPVNTYNHFNDPDRYQPHIDNFFTSQHKPGGSSSGTGNWFFDYEAQQARWGKVFGISSLTSIINQFPLPQASLKSSKPDQRALYYSLLQEVINASANLTDVLKVETEYFDNKVNLVALPFLQLQATTPGLITGSIPWTTKDITYVVIGLDYTILNGALAAWGGKYYVDRVRPISSIQNLLADQKLTAWGGICKGTVNDIPGREWQSYLRTMPHSEYPSATTCICSSLKNTWKSFFGGNDTIPGGPFVIQVPAGSSAREPGCTPAQNVTLTFHTWSEWETRCGNSRINAGVHFRESVNAAEQVCPQVGTASFNWWTSYWRGKATAVVDPTDRDQYSDNDGSYTNDGVYDPDGGFAFYN